MRPENRSWINQKSLGDYVIALYDSKNLRADIQIRHCGEVKHDPANAQSLSPLSFIEFVKIEFVGQWTIWIHLTFP